MSYLIKNKLGSLSSYYGFITDKVEIFEKTGKFSMLKNTGLDCILITPFSLGENIDNFKVILECLGFKTEQRHIKENNKLIIKKTAIKELENLCVNNYFVNTDENKDSIIMFSFVSMYNVKEVGANDGVDDVLNFTLSNMLFCVDSKNERILKKLDKLLYFFPDGREQLKEKFWYDEDEFYEKENFYENEIEELYKKWFPFALNNNIF